MNDRVTLSQVITGGLPYENIIENNAIVLIGAGANGPSMIPIKGVSTEAVASMFGYESELANAYVEASQITSSPIYLIKINGTHRYINLQDKLKIVSLDASPSADDIHIGIVLREGRKSLLITEDSTNKSTYYYLDDGRSLRDIERTINRDAYIGNSPICAISLVSDMADSLELQALTNFTNIGDSMQLSPEQIYDRVSETLNCLLSAPIEQVGILTGNYVEPDTRLNLYLYDVLSQFASDRLAKAQPCMVTVGCSMDYTPTYLFDVLNAFAKVIANPASAIPCTVSEYVNILATKFKVGGTYSSYISNGVATYCAMLAELRAGETTTNKVIPNILENLSEFTEMQLKGLSSCGYVVTSLDSSGGCRVYRGVNLLYGTDGFYYKPGNLIAFQKPYLFGYVGFVLLVQNMSLSIYEKMEPLIGNSTSKREMQLMLDEILGQYKELLKDYSFDINETTEGYTKSYEIEISIVPYGEIDRLRFSISI